MLEIMGCIVLAILGMFLLFVGMALERKLKAQADFFRAEARRSLSDAAYTRFIRERTPPRYKGRVAGLPESMLPSFPKV